MKKNIWKIILFVALVFIATIYPFYFTNLYSYDEIWNFGFAKNILDGLVPYKDFSLIVPPIFPYLTSIVLRIFGQKLIVYYAFIAVIVTSITFISAKQIGWASMMVYINMLIYSSNGYNTASLLLLFILLTLINKKTKHQDIIIPIIISIMVLTKQSLGLLIIPSIIYSKDKKKTIATYIVSFLIFLTYLLLNNNLMTFLDYCLFGMFEFTEKNSLSTPMYLIIELIVCSILIINLIKSKGKKQDLLYVLLYQIITFPIVDISHFVLAWSPIVYLLFKKNNLQKFTKNALFVLILVIEVCALFSNCYTTTIHNKRYLGYSTSETFIKGKLVPSITDVYIEEISKFIERYPNHNLYILGSNSYLIKLFLDIPINKYDLINEGNMGYQGAKKYIEEIENNCQNQKCLFVVNNNELNQKFYNQTNSDILNFVDKNYNKIYSSSVFGIYIN